MTNLSDYDIHQVYPPRDFAGKWTLRCKPSEGVFLDRGYGGLKELLRRPHSQPEQLAVEEVSTIVRL